MQKAAKKKAEDEAIVGMRLCCCVVRVAVELDQYLVAARVHTNMDQDETLELVALSIFVLLDFSWLPVRS